MAVIVDATGTKLITTVAGASVNYTGITVGTGVDRALVVTVATAAAVTAPNAHWDTAGANQAMTLITTVKTQTNVTTFMFGLRNPVAGAKTLNVAWTTSSVSNIEAISFTDVDQTSDAKAFINSNFVSDGGTVSSILMALSSPAGSIAVASYGTSATFSSLTGTNLFTDTTNTGCEGAASRSNGAGVNINFTGADTTTTGNKVMVGFVVAPVITVSSPPLSEPVRPKIAGALAIAIMASGLFSAPLPPKEDVAKVDRWYSAWREPVRAKSGLAAYEQQFLAWAPQPITTTPTAVILLNSKVIFQKKIIYQALAEPVNFTAAVATPTGWNDPVEQPVRNWARSPIYTAPFLALGVPPAQVWFPPNVSPDIDPVRAKPVADFIPWTFLLEPAPQVFFPYDRWPDTAPAAKRVAQNPDLAYGIFVTPTVTPTYTQWTQWPDFAPKAKPPVNFQPWTFVEPPPQVFFPHAPWDDFARGKKPPLDTQPLAWPPTPVAAATVALVALSNSDVIFQKKVIYQALTQPVNFTAAPVINTWAQWPDFAPRAKRAAVFAPWTFIPTPAQVFFPYAPWDDFTRRKQPPLDTQPLAWSTFTPVQVVTYFTTTWPDFATKKQSPLNYDPLTFVQNPQQVFFPYAPWDDFARRKPQPLDTQPLAWSTFTPAPVVTYFSATWPDFAPRARRVADFIPWTFIPSPAQVFFTQWAPWPDLVPTRKKPVVDFQPWVFIEPPPQVFFPYGPWDDFARKKPQPLDTQPLAYGYFLPAPPFFLVPDRWPDFALKAKPPLNYDPLAFLQVIRSPFNSFVNWPDFAPRKKPVADFIPWTFIPTPKQVFFPYWPWGDFVPIRGKIGLHAAQQQFTARFAGTITATTVTITMSAFEVNTDGAAGAILVVQSQPAVDAAVSIKEIGILGGSITP